MKLNNLFILFLFLCTVSVGYTQQCDCKKFRRGKFELNNDNGTFSKIVRTRKFQYEISEGVKLKDKIVWLNECTYKVIPYKITDHTGKIGTDILVIQIVETFDHAYLARITIDQNNFSILVKVYEDGYLIGRASD